MSCCSGRSGPPPSSWDEPTVIGDPTEEVIRARTTIAMSGYRSGQIGYFSGTSVPALVAGSQLVPV